MASCTATTTPPRAVPSSFVTTSPVTGTAAAKVFACITAFCPMVPSSTSSDSCGAPGSRLAMTRATFLSSCMSPSLVCRRPAVSMITTSVPRVTAASMAEKATAAGSPPGCASMKSLPLRSAHTRSWSMAPARKVSPAAIITRLPSRWRRVGQLADERRLAGAVDAEHQHHGRFGVAKRERRVAAAAGERGHQPRVQCGEELRLRLHGATLRLALHRLDEPRGHRHAEIGLEQQRLQLLQGAGVGAAAHEDADVAEGDILDALPEAFPGLEKGHLLESEFGLRNWNSNAEYETEGGIGGRRDWVQSTA